MSSGIFSTNLGAEGAWGIEQMELEKIQHLHETYRLADYLKQHQDRLQVIAEVKKASPSLGDINLDVDIVQQAQTYEANGAVMISGFDRWSLL